MVTHYTSFVTAVLATTTSVVLLQAQPGRINALQAQGDRQQTLALSGVVRSEEEGSMEGVVVSVRGDRSVFSVSVVTDARGVYGFPRSHLEDGFYTVAIRAVGYDLVNPGPVRIVKDVISNIDLELRKTENLARQLSSAEWVLSMPGTPAQKSRLVHQLVSCAYCHTYQRIMESRHTAEDFLSVIQRMGTYYPDGTAVSNNNHRGRAVKNTKNGQRAFVAPPNWGFTPGIPKTELANFLASVNLSGGKQSWDYEFETLPRPAGEATRVIVTQYDMPTAATVAHDMDIDSQGNVWYTDESRQMIGKLDPRTATFTEYELPPVNEGDVPGTRDVQIDMDDKVWFPMRVPGSGTVLTRFDPNTDEIHSVVGTGGQFLAMGPDGKIWIGFTRVDPDTMQVDARFSFREFVPKGASPYVDNSRVDSQGNAWMVTNRGPGGVIGVNAGTGQVDWFPVEGISARRGRIDQVDRLWYGEYLNDKIFMFDTLTKKVRRWEVPEYSTPYTVSVPDKNGYVYAPSNMSERLMRLEPETGTVIEYQMPTEFDAKKIAYDPTTNNVVLWMSNMRVARITKVEFLD